MDWQSMSPYGDKYGVLEQCLRDILHMVKPLESDRRTRENVINKIATSLQSDMGTRGAFVRPFGSFVSNLYTKWGDLDISVHSSTVPGVLGSKMYQKKLLRGIQRALRNSGVAHYIEFIPHARVPLLKFKSSQDSISCDISIDNYLGVFKSKILLWISEIDERFRDMVLLIKEWAKAQRINDPRFGTLNSYSLCLLVIFHFQTCEPAILPPLRDIYQGNLLDEITGTNISERRIEDACGANIRRIRYQQLRQTNKSSLHQLLISFFRKFCDIGRLASENTICTHTGQWERRSIRWSGKSDTLIVDDPFEKAANPARTVRPSELYKISEAFISTYEKLSSSSVLADRKSLLGILTKHVSSSEPRGRSQNWNNAQRSQTHTPTNGSTHTINGIHISRLDRFQSETSHMSSAQATHRPIHIISSVFDINPSTRHPMDSSAHYISGVYGGGRNPATSSSRSSLQYEETGNNRGQQQWMPKYRR